MIESPLPETAEPRSTVVSSTRRDPPERFDEDDIEDQKPVSSGTQVDPPSILPHDHRPR